MGKILVINQCGGGVDPLRQSLTHEGHDINVVNSPQEASRLMSTEPFELALIRCHAVAATLAYVLELKQQDPGMTIILMVTSSMVQMPYEAIQAGADGLVFRPFRVDRIRRAVVEGLKMHELKAMYEEVPVAGGA